ncbi:unnamed protein product, partial [marine sediment metagenome]
FDAMMSERSYRSALSPEQVAEEIGRGAGTHFDPEAVDALLRISNSLVRLFEYATESNTDSLQDVMGRFEGQDQLGDEMSETLGENGKLLVEEAQGANTR